MTRFRVFASRVFSWRWHCRSVPRRTRPVRFAALSAEGPLRIVVAWSLDTHMRTSKQCAQPQAVCELTGCLTRIFRV
jgi:hypothetical protein